MDQGVEVHYESAGVQLFARVRGTGPPVVLLHGSGLTTHSSLNELACELATTCQVVACDVRGYGRSVSRDPASHTWRQYALDVVALLDHLKIATAIVGGYSLGAAIALVTALEHPDRVAGLVLAQAAFAGADIGRTGAQERLWARSRALLETARTHGLKHALVARSGSPEEAAALSAAADNHDEQSLLAAHEGELQTAQPFASLQVLKRVTVPTLLLPGDDDTHPPEVSSWYAQHLPHATLGPATAALVRGRGLNLQGKRPPPVAWESRWLRWPDWWLPADPRAARDALIDLWERAATQRVEVACSGGQGRTGTALARLAIIDGVAADDAVAYVRKNYNRRALETPWQRRYVARFH